MVKQFLKQLQTAGQSPVLQGLGTDDGSHLVSAGQSSDEHLLLSPCELYNIIIIIIIRQK